MGLPREGFGNPWRLLNPWSFVGGPVLFSRTTDGTEWDGVRSGPPGVDVVHLRLLLRLLPPWYPGPPREVRAPYFCDDGTCRARSASGIQSERESMVPEAVSGTSDSDRPGPTLTSQWTGQGTRGGW